MSKPVVSYLRIAVCSLMALLAVACARYGGVESPLSRTEPRVGEPPKAEAVGLRSYAEADPVAVEQERVEALERQVASLSNDIAHLRHALEIMGPLPEQPEFFIPVAQSKPVTVDEEGFTGISSSEVYAAPPQLMRSDSLFFEAELGSYISRPAAEASWKKVASEIRLTGLQPRYSQTESMIRLTAGPLTSEAAVDALCIELASLSGPCRAAVPIRAY